MSTRSLIGIKNPDSSITYIYCHFDSYPAHHGPILMKHYNNREIVNDLMDLGDLSQLANRLKTDKPHSWKNPVSGVCVAYGRDRGETGVDCKTVNDVKEYIQAGEGVFADHLYLFDPTINKWTIDTNRGVFIELTEDMCE